MFAMGQMLSFIGEKRVRSYYDAVVKNAATFPGYLTVAYKI